MTSNPAVSIPAGFVPAVAISYGAPDGPATAVDASHPLPIAATMGGAGSTPLAGTTAVTATAGPFTPTLGRPIWLTLSGSWGGTAQVLRSTDGGTTKLALTYGDASPKGSFGANLNAPVAEETVAGATYYLQVTLAGGSLSYRMEQ